MGQHKNKKPTHEFVIKKSVPPPPAPAPSYKEQFVARAQRQLEDFLKSDRRLVFPSFSNPEVSIIIVTYTQTALELMCLLSVLRWCSPCKDGADISYEVVISNNGNSEINKQLLSRLDNVVVINNEKNEGFVKGVNIGAEHASGEFLLFLNDDAMVSYECVQNLTKRMRTWEQTKTGVAGAQILRLNYTIQDAGGILGTDGTASEYCKGFSPEVGEVNFVREVDYVSGACFMTPRELFFKLNKFDEIYSPGYCEESDYCLRVREAGYKVIYDASARILHYEYGSSDPSKVTDLVKEHTSILYNRHKNLLSAGYPSQMVACYARTNRRHRGRALIITDMVPRPEYGDDKILDYINKLVDQNIFVTVFPLHQGVDDWMSVHDHLPETVEVMLREDIGKLIEILNARPRYYDYLISKVYDFSQIISKSHVLAGKYVFQLGKDEDFDCPRLLEILKPTVLWVDWHIPEHDTNAGDYAVYSYCSQLQELGYRIRYWSDDLAWRAQDSKYIQTLAQKDWEFWNASGYTFEQTMRDLGHTVDLVVLARPLAVNYIEAIRKYSKAPIIYYCHDLHHLRELRQIQTTCDPNYTVLDTESVQKTKKVEYDIINKTDLLVTVSQFEKEYIDKELPDAKVSVWPWYCPPRLRQTNNQIKNQIIFLGGMQHTPNQDAIRWFTSEIFLQVKESIPEARLVIIGEKAPEDIVALHNDKDICVAGHMEDITTFLQSSSLLVAPIRFGAGFKGKIAMAMSHGLPVVTTSLGAEGIGLTQEENVLIADTAEDFARQIVRAMRGGNGLWRKLSNNSIEFATNNWSAKVVQEHLRKDIESLNAEGVAVA